MKLIERNLYLGRLIETGGTPDTKVIITGVNAVQNPSCRRLSYHMRRRTTTDANNICVNFSLPE